MGKKKKNSGNSAGTRSRVNPLTGQVESVSGTKAGKKRTRTSYGDPLRTHDLRVETKKSKNKRSSNED